MSTILLNQSSLLCLPNRKRATLRGIPDLPLPYKHKSIFESITNGTSSVPRSTVSSIPGIFSPLTLYLQSIQRKLNVESWLDRYNNKETEEEFDSTVIFREEDYTDNSSVSSQQVEGENFPPFENVNVINPPEPPSDQDTKSIIAGISVLYHEIVGEIIPRYQLWKFWGEKIGNLGGQKKRKCFDFTEIARLCKEAKIISKAFCKRLIYIRIATCHQFKISNNAWKQGLVELQEFRRILIEIGTNGASVTVEPNKSNSSNVETVRNRDTYSSNTDDSEIDILKHTSAFCTKGSGCTKVVALTGNGADGTVAQVNLSKTAAKREKRLKIKQRKIERRMQLGICPFITRHEECPRGAKRCIYLHRIITTDENVYGSDERN
jgi:hypothetical protein